MDTPKYLGRINYAQELQPSLAVLSALQKTHLLHVPFENLDIHTGVPIRLDMERIYEKVILNRRGGFCYELNGLFYELLQSLGFTVKRISGRVYVPDKGYTPEFSHFAILVNLGQTEYLTDVGFGDFTLGPLKMELGQIQKDPTGDFLIDTYDDTYFRVNKMEHGAWVPQYVFTNQARDFAEYEEMCLFHQTSSHSPFTQKRLISIPTEQGRITITGNTLKIRDKTAVKEVILENEEAFTKYLWEYFGVTLNH